MIPAQINERTLHLANFNESPKKSTREIKAADYNRQNELKAVNILERERKKSVVRCWAKSQFRFLLNKKTGTDNV